MAWMVCRAPCAAPDRFGCCGFRRAWFGAGRILGRICGPHHCWL